jgi:hypothetical protein
MTETEAQTFAQEWIDAWNSHDLDRILSHYDPQVVLTSPVAARLLGDPAGKVAGIGALEAYFRKGLEVFPNLAFQLLGVLNGLSSVVLQYRNQNGKTCGEYMEFGPDGKVVRVVAHYAD